MRPAKTRPREDRRPLIVIANPTDFEVHNLDPVDVRHQLTLARDCLGSIGLGGQPLDALYRLDEGEEPVPNVNHLGSPTLKNLVKQLRGRPEVLYLLCHGRLEEEALEGGGTRKVPKLWLEHDDGTADKVSALRDDNDPEKRAGLVTHISQGTQLPRLIILASCQSAGEAEDWVSSDGGARTALGPLLAKEGVPAVIAMQGNVKTQTVAEFVPAFFEALLQEETNGQIDWAMAAARKAAEGRPDWWAPALFMNLPEGRIEWYEPRFSGEEAELATWEGLCSAIKRGRCTPVLGPGLLEFLMGSRRQIADRWAEGEEGDPYPMAPHKRQQLHQVARYLATIKGDPFLPSARLENLLREETLRRYGHMLDHPEALLPELVHAVGKELRAQDESEPHRVLARLPSSIYINANPDDLLYDALVEAGREPRRVLCPWNRDLDESDVPADLKVEAGFAPTREQPLVYHLLGHMSVPESIVLSEDQYFDYLVWVSQDRTRGEDQAIPSKVGRALTMNALIFLGFEIDDWNLRVLLHSLINPRNQPLNRPNSLAVQVSPDRDSVLDPELACKYLEQYLGHFRKVCVNIYWGTVQVFLRKLWERRAEWKPAGWNWDGEGWKHLVE
jgi:hypothetical protein